MKSWKLLDSEKNGDFWCRGVDPDLNLSCKRWIDFKEASASLKLWLLEVSCFCRNIN